MEKFYKRFKNFKNCLETLNESKTRKNYETDKLVLSGIIHHFCLVFDLSWKVIKDIATEYYGFTDFNLGSPRGSLEIGFQLNLIEDDNVWFKLLKLRNELSHNYDSILAIDSCNEILFQYADVFNDLKDRIENLIKEIEIKNNI